MKLLVLLIFFVVLIGILFAIYKAVVYAHRNLGKVFKSQKIIWLSCIVLAIVSCAVGVWFVVFSYYSSETQRLHGIPLPWAVWEFRNGFWMDFVSPILLLFLPLDFVFGIGIMHFLAAIVLFLKNRNAKQIK